MTLNAKQQAFVTEYLIDLNATQAAIRAGYKPTWAGTNADKLLKNTKVLAAIEAGKRERIERVKVDADYVLKRLVEIDQMDVADLLDEAGNIKKVSEWPKVWRTTLSGLDMHEIMFSETETIVKKIKWPDKTRNLELLGKHVTVQAFKDKIEMDPQEHRHSLDDKTLKALKKEILAEL